MPCTLWLHHTTLNRHIIQSFCFMHALHQNTHSVSAAVFHSFTISKQTNLMNAIHEVINFDRIQLWEMYWHKLFWLWIRGGANPLDVAAHASSSRLHGKGRSWRRWWSKHTAWRWRHFSSFSCSIMLCRSHLYSKEFFKLKGHLSLVIGLASETTSLADL